MGSARCAQVIVGDPQESGGPDAFFHYYSQFTRDQDYLDANLRRLKTPVKVVWGEKDIYISPEMGREFAARANAELTLLPGIGHYAHLQAPEQVAAEIRASFRDRH